MSRFMRRPKRHMCTIIHVTDAAATRASGPSSHSWFAAWKSRYPATVLSASDSATPHRTAEIRAPRPDLRRYARMMATIRKASNPSRSVMTKAWIMTAADP